MANKNKNAKRDAMWLYMYDLAPDRAYLVALLAHNNNMSVSGVRSAINRERRRMETKRRLSEK